MRLFIAEKPSLAKAIYTELGVVNRGDGYMECRGGDIVTWCFGHLLEQAEPDAYLPDSVPKTKKGKKIWRMEDLPIFPREWINEVKPDKGVKKQYSTIKKLLAKSASVVNAGDPDREGCLLIDEILVKCKYKKPVQRFWASAIDPASIRKALANLKPNANYKGMSNAALARSRSDWLLGMNLTRAYTLSAKDSAGKAVLTVVGRVQTPTLALVARRDYAIKNFKPQAYLKIVASLTKDAQTFSAVWSPESLPPGWGDEEGKLLINLSEGRKLAARLSGARAARIINVQKKAGKSQPPKCYSLADIQQDASAKYGFTAEQTLNVCQSLYEKHKVASYPRTDCGFLPESQFADAPKVLAAIAQTVPAAKALVDHADPSIKSSVWNDKKITAHHGIIPTALAGSWESFSTEEKKIYALIIKRYIAQFYPAHEYETTSVDADIGGEPFKAKGRVTIKEGWKAVYAADERQEKARMAQSQSPEDEEKAEAQREQNQTLPALAAGETVRVSGVNGRELQTKPPSAYTEGTLIAAMESIHKAFADHPKVQAQLKESDGIGTPATRAAIIGELKRRKYLLTKGKALHASEEGVALLRRASPSVRSAVLTAQWEEKLKMVEAGTMSVEGFTQDLEQFISGEINKAKAGNA